MKKFLFGTLLIMMTFLSVTSVVFADKYATEAEGEQCTDC